MDINSKSLPTLRSLANTVEREREKHRNGTDCFQTTIGLMDVAG